MKTKRLITYSLLALLTFSFMGIASAEEIIVVDDEYNFFTDFLHTLQDLGLFTAAGQNRECSIDPDYTYTTTDANPTIYNTQLLSSCSSGVALYNIFDTTGHYLAEYKSELIGSGLTTPAPRIIEVYCCPYEACTSSSDCDDYPASNYGSLCYIDEGYCYDDPITYTTPIMKCTNDAWVHYDDANPGDIDHCLEGRSNWIDRDGATHSCRESSYSLMNDGTWCGYVDDVAPTCSDGIQNGAETGIDCGGSCSACLSDQLVLSGSIYDIQLFQDSFIEGELVDVRFRAKNKGDAGYYLIETGIIPKSVASSWGFVNEGLFSFWNPTTNTECCENQQNIYAKTIYFGEGEEHEIQIDIPKAPYSGITDLCYDNNYWDGEGEYVLYVIMKTGCYPEGENVVYETKIININNTIPGTTPNITGDTKTLTWSEFYSMTDESFSKKIKKTKCYSDTDCPTIKEYTVTCEDNEVISERLYEISVDSCDDNMGIIDELLTIVKLGIGSGSYCEMVVDTWGSEGYVVSFLQWIGEKAGIESPKGYCIAESTTWYGSAWESTLKMMGGMGLPTQYVFLITIMLLLTLAGIIIRMVTQ